MSYWRRNQMGIVGAALMALSVILLCASLSHAQVSTLVPGSQTTPYTVATLPTGFTGRMAYVSNGSSATDCTVGGGSNKVLCIYNGSAWVWAANGAGTGSGDVSGPASSVDGEIPLYSLTTGKVLKRATGSGIVKVSLGVFGLAVAGDFPTLNQNTTGTAANISGTPALPNGTTATTQSQADNSTKLSTTAYVDTGLAGKLTSTPTATQIEGPLFCADAGANDTYQCNLSPAPASYVVGTHLRFKANTANTGAASINFSSLGALTLVKTDSGGVSVTLADNDIRAGKWIDCVVAAGSTCQVQNILGNAASGGGGASGTGAVGTVPKVTNATGPVYGDSRITDDGTDIKIDSGNHRTVIGDIADTPVGLGTKITVDDSSGTIRLETNAGDPITAILDIDGFHVTSLDTNLLFATTIGSDTTTVHEIYFGNASFSSRIYANPTADRTNSLPDYNGEFGVTVSKVSTGSVTTDQSGLFLADGIFTLSAGLYRVDVYIEVTSANTAGTLAVTIGWTDDAGARTATNGTNGMPLTLNTATTTFAQGSTVFRTTGSVNATYNFDVTQTTGTATYRAYAVITRLL